MARATLATLTAPLRCARLVYGTVLALPFLLELAPAFDCTCHGARSNLPWLTGPAVSQGDAHGVEQHLPLLEFIASGHEKASGWSMNVV